MREILFKAKRLDNGEWVEGYYYKRIQEKEIVDAIEKCDGTVCSIEYYQIKTETLCQYTGLTDKNGNKIWENDILSIAKKSDGMGGYYFPSIPYPVNVFVRWDLCSWMWETIEKRKHYISFPDAWCHYEAEVIGNIFDNADLLQ